MNEFSFYNVSITGSILSYPQHPIDAKIPQPIYIQVKIDYLTGLYSDMTTVLRRVLNQGGDTLRVWIDQMLEINNMYESLGRHKSHKKAN